MFTEDSISLVSGFLLFCLFGLGAFALSRFIGKYGKAFQKGRYMKVVDQIQIAQEEYEEPASPLEGRTLEDFLPFLRKKREGDFSDIFHRKKENRSQEELNFEQVSERSPDE